MQDKMKYEKPELIDLRGHSTTTSGLCGPGSGDSAVCTNGITPKGSPTCGNGTSPPSFCAQGFGKV